MNFNRLAAFYPWMERFLAGNLMQRCRTLHLPQCRQQRRALLVGEGTGKFLVELLRSNPVIEITCVEHSQKMIDQIRRRLALHRLDTSRIRFENTDFLTWPAPAESFDLISTHFFLDCFNSDQLPKVIAKLAAISAPDAVWLFSDFQIPTAGWPRWRAKLIVVALYQFFRLTTQLSARELISPDKWIEQAGFVLHQRQSLSFGLTHSDAWKKSALISAPSDKQRRLGQSHFFR